MKDDRVIEVNDLKVRFLLDDNIIVNAVKGVSFHINKGETLALVGESGSGKSVTAMTIMRLTEYAGAQIASGSMQFRKNDGQIVELKEKSLTEMQDIRGSDMSMIFQEPMTSLNPVLTIGSQISEAVIRHQKKNKSEAWEVALEMLQFVRVPAAEKRMKQFPHNLSGGMRQRAMIAMALCCRPALMIADEPTTALDVTIQAQILDLMKLLQKEIGMSVLFITHDMGVVAEIADRICVMFKGEIVEEGDVYKIFDHPKHPYTKALLAAVPRLGSMSGKDEPEKFPILKMRDTFEFNTASDGEIN